MGDIVTGPVELFVSLVAFLVPLVLLGAVVYALVLLRRLVRLQQQIVDAFSAQHERDRAGRE